MLITDRALACHYLERIGYYRLSGYWHVFRKAELGLDARGKPTNIYLDQFREGTTFSNVVDLYVFDKKLRIILLDAIERIEVALRVDIALLLGARDPLAHRKKDQLHRNFARNDPANGKTYHENWLDRLNENERRSREDFVTHFRNTYSTELPIWIAIELWDFGILSKFFGNMKVVDKDNISAKYGVVRSELLASWIRSINHVRNVCAHHGRLWNISPADQPKPPLAGEINVLDHLAEDPMAHYRLYGIVAPMHFLLKTINPSSKWCERLKAHVGTFPKAPGLTFNVTGFPEGWEKLQLWTNLVLPA